MRQVLVEHARHRDAAKRGGHWERVPLDDLLDGLEKQNVDVTALRQSLDDMAAVYERPSEVITLRYFGGLTVAEVAALLESCPTEERHAFRAGVAAPATEGARCLPSTRNESTSCSRRRSVSLASAGSRRRSPSDAALRAEVERLWPPREARQTAPAALRSNVHGPPGVLEGQPVGSRRRLRGAGRWVAAAWVSSQARQLRLNRVVAKMILDKAHAGPTAVRFRERRDGRRLQPDASNPRDRRRGTYPP
jgi:hypothetical protein